MADYRIGFRSLADERRDHELDVEGTIPGWLDGALIRNGPARFDAGGERFRHWFDGLAMLRRFEFAEGGVRYTNRFLRTQAYADAVDENSLGSPQFGTTPSGYLASMLSSLVPSPTDNTNVNVMRAGDAFVALTETPRYTAFDPETLETLGEWDFDDDISAHLACAHPVVDPRTGHTLNLGTRFGLTHEYRVTSLPPDSQTRETLATVETERVAYMHSFAVTEQYVVLVEPPLFVDLITLLNPLVGSSFLDTLTWRPRKGSRFIVIDREKETVAATIEGPPFFYFHQANAFEDGDEIHIDLVTFEDASVLQALSLEALAEGAFSHPMGDLVRFRVDPAAGDLTREPRYDGHLSLPRVNETIRTHDYQYVYAQGAEDESRIEFPTALRKIDVTTGGTTTWADPALYCGEPVFVPHPDRVSEDAGVVLSVVLDTDAERSGLLVLDGKTFEDVALAWLPHVLPFDFHGQYYRRGTDRPASEE